MQVVYKTHYKKIITSTSTVQITHFLKVEKMCLSNIQVLTFALNHFTPRRNKYTNLSFFFSILIQCNIGRYRELKKIIIKPGYIVSNQHQDQFRSWSGRARTGLTLFHKNNSNDFLPGIWLNFQDTKLTKLCSFYSFTYACIPYHKSTLSFIFRI